MSLLKYHLPPPTQFLVGCRVFLLICWPRRQWSLFCRIIHHSKWQQYVLPTGSTSFTFPLQSPLQLLTMIFGRLLYITNKQRSHNGEPPSPTLYFEGSCLSTQNKVKESACKNKPMSPGVCIGLMGNCGAMLRAMSVVSIGERWQSRCGGNSVFGVWKEPANRGGAQICFVQEGTMKLPLRAYPCRNWYKSINTVTS